MSPKKINPVFDGRITFFSLFPYIEQLAQISSDAEFLMRIENLVRITAPELVGGNVDSLLTAMIDFNQRKQHMYLVDRYTKCRERLRNYRSARPETQSITPAHTEGKELAGMHDEILAMSDIQNIIDFSNEYPDIFKDDSLKELKGTAELTRDWKEYRQMGLLYCERLGMLQLLSGLQKEALGNHDESTISQIMELMWLGGPAIFPFTEKHPELLRFEISDVIKNAGKHVTDNDTRLIITLRRHLFLLPKIRGEKVLPIDYVDYEETLVYQCEGKLQNMILALTEGQHRDAVADIIEFFINDFPESKTDLMNFFNYYFPN